MRWVENREYEIEEVKEKEFVELENKKWEDSYGSYETQLYIKYV